MDETLKYVKEQCYIYNRYNEASQTKGLIRAIENAQQVNRNLTYTKDEVTKDKLKTYAEEQKLTGIIILDVNGKVKCEYSTDNLNSRALQNEIQKKTVLDVVAYLWCGNLPYLAWKKAHDCAYPKLQAYPPIFSLVA